MSNVEEVKNRIIKLAREVEELSQSNLPPEDFFTQFLARVIGAVGARAGAVWMKRDAGTLDRIADQGFDEPEFNITPEGEVHNQKILQEVISNGQARIFSNDDGSSFECPTDDLVVTSALLQGRDVVGVVEIFQRAKSTPHEARTGFLQFLEQMTGYACRYLDRQAAMAPSPEIAELADDFEELVRKLHKSLDVKEITSIIAELGPRVANCDRMSVAVMRGKKAIIMASSDSDNVDRFSQQTRLMADLSAKAILTREPLVFEGNAEDYPPQIEKPLVSYLTESKTKMLIVVPFFQTDPMIQHEVEGPKIRSKEFRRIPIGGVMIEQFEESKAKPGQLERVQMIAEHASASLSNSKAYHGLYFLGLWKLLGSTYALLEGRGFVKTLAVVAAIAALISAFMFVPYEYRVECEGRLMPQEQADVFAPRDGRVERIGVTGLANVEKGQELIWLANDDLEAQILAQRSLIAAKKKQLDAVAAEFDAADSAAQFDDSTRLSGKLLQTDLELKHAINRLNVLTERAKSLVVKAPMKGVVSTFEIEQLLKDRPVRRGELLLEIKNDKGPWRLELTVEEQRVGHLFKIMDELETDTLPIEFVLKTDTEKVYFGELTRVTSRVNAEAEVGSIFLVFATADDKKIENCRIGAEVRAKVSCGERSLGYVLVGDVIEFLQRRFWIDRWYDDYLKFTE